MTTIIEQRERFRDRLAGYSILLLAFSIPYSTSLVNILSALCVILWLASGFVLDDVRKVSRTATGKVLIGFLLFALLSIAWSSAPQNYIIDGISKLRKIFLILIIWMLLARLVRFQKLTLISVFCSFSLLTLICFGIYIGLPGFPEMTPGQGAVFMRSHIAQGYFLSVLVCICAGILFLARGNKTKLIGLVFFIISLIVIFYMTNGRTGYVCLISVLAVMSITIPVSMKKRVLLIGMAGLLIAVTFFSSDRMEKRWGDAVSDVQQLEVGNSSTSVGYRIRAWKESLAMLKERPLFGVGIGSWGVSFCQNEAKSPEGVKKCNEEIKIGNPHSDYLNWFSQFGLIGGGLWLIFLFCVMKKIFQLSSERRCFLLAALVSYLVGALFNSFMWDIGEGTLSVLMFGLILSTIKNRREFV